MLNTELNKKDGTGRGWGRRKVRVKGSLGVVGKGGGFKIEKCLTQNLNFNNRSHIQKRKLFVSLIQEIIQ